MHITEVRIKLTEDTQERLLAFCSITLDGCFVVRDLKIIQGGKGPFVAMPSRKLTDHCSRCHCKNHLRSCYCQQCGLRLGDDRALKDLDGRARLYADIAHPINSVCRDHIQERVIEDYELELIKSQEPGYVCRYDDFGDECDSLGPWEEPAISNRPVAESARSQATSPDTMRRVDTPRAPTRGPHRVQRDRVRATKNAEVVGDFGDGIM